jgi:hypothetical protein
MKALKICHARQNKGNNRLLPLALALLFCSMSQALADPTNLVLKGAWPVMSNGAVSQVTVAGSHAYVACGSAGLAVLDVSNPAQSLRQTFSQ